MNYTYLLINMGAILVPLLFSFHPWLKFSRQWKIVFPSIIVSAVPFIIWDAIAVRNGVWGFNEQYLAGMYLYNLPLEEVLFFICIPYCCMFSYHCTEVLFPGNFTQRPAKVLTPVLVVILLVLGIIHPDKGYTPVTSLTTAGLLVLAQYMLKVTWMTRFYMVFGLLLIPFLLVNGLLTGTGLEAPVVRYNERDIVGYRVLTIPVEDVIYALEMILLNVLLYHWFRHYATRFRQYTLKI